MPGSLIDAWYSSLTKFLVNILFLIASPILKVQLLSSL